MVQEHQVAVPGTRRASPRRVAPGRWRCRPRHPRAPPPGAADRSPTAGTWTTPRTTSRIRRGLARGAAARSPGRTPPLAPSGRVTSTGQSVRPNAVVGVGGLLAWSLVRPGPGPPAPRRVPRACRGRRSPRASIAVSRATVRRARTHAVGFLRTWHDGGRCRVSRPSPTGHVPSGRTPRQHAAVRRDDSRSWRTRRSGVGSTGTRRAAASRRPPSVAAVERLPRG